MAIGWTVWLAYMPEATGLRRHSAQGRRGFLVSRQPVEPWAKRRGAAIGLCDSCRRNDGKIYLQIILCQQFRCIFSDIKNLISLFYNDL